MQTDSDNKYCRHKIYAIKYHIGNGDNKHVLSDDLRTNANIKYYQRRCKISSRNLSSQVCSTEASYCNGRNALSTTNSKDAQHLQLFSGFYFSGSF